MGTGQDSYVLTGSFFEQHSNSVVVLALQDRRPVLRDGYAHTRTHTIRNACNTLVLRQPPPSPQLQRPLTRLYQLFLPSQGGVMLTVT